MRRRRKKKEGTTFIARARGLAVAIALVVGSHSEAWAVDEFGYPESYRCENSAVIFTYLPGKRHPLLMEVKELPKEGRFTRFPLLAETHTSTEHFFTFEWINPEVKSTYWDSETRILVVGMAVPRDIVLPLEGESETRFPGRMVDGMFWHVYPESLFTEANMRLARDGGFKSNEINCVAKFPTVVEEQ